MAVRQVMNAQSSSTVPIAPAARSIAALLKSIDVADADLDGVVYVLMTDERFASSAPTTYLEIVKEARLAHAVYLDQLMRVVDAETSTTKS